MTVTNTPSEARAQAAANIIARHTKHRTAAPFSGELLSFTRSLSEQASDRKYHYLSEDYFQHTASLDSEGNLRILVESQKADVVARTEAANHELENLGRFF